MNDTLSTLQTCQIIAYLDPGTGSIILQSVVAGIFGAVIAIKVFWRRIVNFFKGNSGESAEASNTENKSEG